METFILILLFIFILILIIIMFLLLKKTIIKINQQSKAYFVDKLQVYDDLINEKEKKLKGLDTKLENKQKEIENIEKETEGSQDIYLYDIKNINYQDEKIFQKMKALDNKFNVNTLNLIKKFVTEQFNDENIQEYQSLIECKARLNHDMVYKIVSKTPREQEKIVKDLLKENSTIVDDFVKKNKKFNILKFISHFNKIIDKKTPFIYVYVGKKEENYDSIHPFIRTIVDDKIYKGVLIIYKGKLYDYSLK